MKKIKYRICTALQKEPASGKYHITYIKQEQVSVLLIDRHLIDIMLIQAQYILMTLLISICSYGIVLTTSSIQYILSVLLYGDRLLNYHYFQLISRI